MSRFVIAAHVTAAEGHAEGIAAELAGLAEKTRAEAGCLRYAVCRDTEAAGCFLIYEIWQSEADWRAHLETPHLVRFKDEVLPGRGTLAADKLRFA